MNESMHCCRYSNFLAYMPMNRLMVVGEVVEVLPGTDNPSKQLIIAGEGKTERIASPVML